MTNSPTRLLACSLWLVAGMPTTLLAASSSEVKLEEITVTARKRSENLQDVPISITAFNEDAIRNTGTNSLADLYASVPNFDFTNTGVLVNSSITIRGVISNDNQAGFETATGTVVDDVYIGRSTAYSTGLLDVERIEILRGPQGTLQGKNITGGAINITTRRPTRDLAGAVDLTAGDLGLRQFRGYLSGPLGGDRVLGKLSAMYRERDGSVRNTFTGNSLGNEDSKAVAAQFLIMPTSALEILIGGDYVKDDVRDNSAVYTAPGEITRFLTPTTLSRKVSEEFDSTTNRKVFGAFARVSYSMQSDNTLTSVSAYRGYDLNSKFEQDGTPSLLVNTGKIQEQRQFSQELRLASPADGRVSWLGGLYFFHEKIDEQTRGAFFAFGADTIALAKVSTDSIAGYGSLTFKQSERLSATVGLRYTHDDRKFEGSAGFLGLAPAGLPVCIPPAGAAFCPFSSITIPLPIAPNEFSDGEVTGDLTVNYKWSPSMSTYAKYARGYKGGGFQTNLASTTLGDSVAPEFVDSFEVGYRSMFMDDRIRFNVTAFYLDWKDRQVVDFDPTILGNVARNDKKATSAGAELEFVAQVSQALSVELNAGFLDATIKEGFIGRPGASPLSLNGNDTPFAPKTSVSGALQFRQPIAANLMLFARGELNWRDSYFLNSENTYSSPSVTLVNARIGLESRDGRYGLHLWGKNLADKDVVQFGYLVPLPPPVGPKLGVVLRDPRTFGVTFNAKF